MNTTITLYFNEAEWSRYNKSAQAKHMAKVDFVAWCIKNASLIDTKKAKAIVGNTSGRKASNVRVDPAVVEIADFGAADTNTSRAMFALWCIENSALIPDVPLATPIKKSKPKMVVKVTQKPSTKPRVIAMKPSKSSPRPTSLLELVGQMTITELSMRTQRSVRDIVEFAMGSATAKMVALKNDEQVLEGKMVN